ncbi:hypothetical protein QWJ34_18185 [Saccharibacillus sp. CPCC 101409]|uniref:hypothetical protein n=1 Tax=Saccharibacillus sp. CPCC 101409 TaxID=3058041 RepID=UPI002672EB8E|nr:hypothetical protein [Saccharibacillus sp. CPCC 101409]MDO3411697.1 hypothetical protein [Saccharibacillus sp. CPCC 101409]
MERSAAPGRSPLFAPAAPIETPSSDSFEKGVPHAPPPSLKRGGGFFADRRQKYFNVTIDFLDLSVKIKTTLK